DEMALGTVAGAIRGLVSQPGPVTVLRLQLVRVGPQTSPPRLATVRPRENESEAANENANT
ncbi:MAG: hypothetical protein FWD63_07850, partial [Propionibacteriaceae bacterium]|nr:hypothetical protein [Propionibacteriaceae bacterium]